MSVIYSTESWAPRTTARQIPVLPVLVILFIVSYVILAMLVFEQGQTIESQRTLIREMLKDSTQLASLKGKLARDDSKRLQSQLPAQADHKDAKAGAAPATTTGSDKETKRPAKSARSLKQVPQKPSSDLEDVRRSTQVI